MIKNVKLIKHTLIDHSLTILRDTKTKTEEFRRHAAIVSKILLVEATRQLDSKKKRIKTPLAPFLGSELKDEVIVVPVLRAGLAMLLALQDFLPNVAVGFIGLERDEQTAIAREYYQKLPRIFSTHKVLVLDPMLATGGSFSDTVNVLKNKKARQITLISIVSAPEGIKRIQKDHPEVFVVTAAIDISLNSKKFIVPGLGDFGDRYFGT